MADSVAGVQGVRFGVRLAVLLPTCCLLASVPCALGADEEAPVAQSGAAESATEAVEVVTVVGERRELTAADRRRIYEELATGHRLYSEQKVNEAFPYLLNTAERGFKDSQAKVGHIFAYGLGDVERDTSQAVGWLGVAAAGGGSRPAKNYFNTIWGRIPEQHVPYFEEVVEEFKSKYGERATGVVCGTYRPTHSHIKRDGCFFEADLDERTLEALTDYFAEREQHFQAAVREQELRRLQEQQARENGED